MNKILLEYQERLINLTSKNMSLVLNKIYKKKCFDIVTINRIINSKSKEIEEFIESGYLSVELLPNPQKWYIERKKEIKLSIIKIINNYPESLLDYNDLLVKFTNDIERNIEKKKKFFPKVESKMLTKSYLINLIACSTFENKEIIVKIILHQLYEELDFEFNLLINMSKSLDFLSRETSLEKKETGISNLFISYNFVEGKFLDDSKCRAPLSLLRVDLLKENGVWKIVNKNNSDLEINKVFLLSGFQNNEINGIRDLTFNLNENLEHVEQFLSFYKKNGLEIINSNLDYEELKPYSTIESYQKYKMGELVVKKHLIIGRFPTSNAIYEDYELMIKNKLVNNQIQSLLSPNSRSGVNKLNETNIKERDLNERDYYFISKLDFSQELSLKKVEENNNLVIFGPPGTGKSETIANIISDSLAKGKRVLMVSQKRAALDVLYNRLSCINNKMVLIHDAESGKKEFYHRIKTLTEDYEERFGNNLNLDDEASKRFVNFLDIEKKINDHSDIIENHLDQFRKISKILYKNRFNGIHLQETYNKSWKCSLSDSDQIYYYNQYIKIKSKLPNLEYNHNKLLKFVGIIREKDLLNVYVKYREIIVHNPLLEKIITKPDFFSVLDIRENTDEIDIFLKNLKNLYNEDDFKFIYNLFMKSITVDGARKEVDSYLKNKYNELLLPSVCGFNRLVKSVFNKKTLVELEESNKLKYDRIFKKNMEDLVYIYDGFKNITDKIKIVGKILNSEQCDLILESTKNNFKFISYEKIKNAVDLYDEYLDLSDELEELNSIELEFIHEVYANIEKNPSKFIYMYPEIRLYELLSVEYKYDKDIREVNRIVKNYTKYTKETKSSMSKKSELTKDLILSKWDEKFLKSVSTCNYREFKRLSNLKKGFRPIREYMENFQDILMDMFPCYLMGPETVSRVLPLKKDMFDIIIFDEASQMFVEESIPSLYRAAKAVVAGDDMQLKPSSLFKKKYLETQNNDYNQDTAAAIEEESLLDLAKITYSNTHLNFHYRSKYSELINFSNFAFYNGKLKLSPNISKVLEKPPIERIMVQNALWENRCNIDEAEVVVNTLQEILENRTNEETIGIITFNIGQQDVIFEVIESRMINDSIFKGLILKERNRTKGGEDISLFIKNIENVQGDERDIIIFSTGYAKNSTGKLVQQFGTLSQRGGENRLNVAISRAKEKVYVITSFEPEELNTEKTKQLGPVRFKQYLQYARAISNFEEKNANQILKSVVDLKFNVNRTIIFDSPFELEVYDKLRLLGYEVHTQVGTSGYSIDLAIYDRDTSMYVLGIECDGASYHSSVSARERDIHRQKFLESRGWQIERIWSTDWWNNDVEVIKKLKVVIDNSLSTHKAKYYINDLKIKSV